MNLHGAAFLYKSFIAPVDHFHFLTKIFTHLRNDFPAYFRRTKKKILRINAQKTWAKILAYL